MIFRRRSTRPENPHQLPRDTRIYAVGDIHGRIDLLDDICGRIDADLRARPVEHPLQVFVGDYVDRGPHSREVVNALIARAEALPTVCLRGNHEAFLDEFLRDSAVLAGWARFGGLETLLSYGLKPAINPSADAQAKLQRELNDALPARHREFLGLLRPYFEFGPFYFVHAGVRPGIPLSSQSEDDLLWIREEFLLCEERFEKLIIHGHTPVAQPDVRRNRINIDTGAYATGRLTCLVLECGGQRFL